MEWHNYLLVVFLLGGLFFASAIYVLFWSARNRQFQDLEQGARTIFDEEEPEGVQTDFFPGKKVKGIVRTHPVLERHQRRN